MTLAADAASSPIVEMRGITISPGVLALDNVDFFLRPEKCIPSWARTAQASPPHQGSDRRLCHRQWVDRRDWHRQVFGTSDAEAAGISTVYQEINLCTNLSVGENVMLGHERAGRTDRLEGCSSTGGRASRGLGISIDTRSLLSNHSIAIQQLVAISRDGAGRQGAGSRRADIQPGSRRSRAALLCDPRSAGKVANLCEPLLDQVYEIADRITVLRNGKLVGEYLVRDLPRDELVTKMIGRQLDDLEAISSTAARAITARMRRSSKQPAWAGGVLEPADLDVFGGEIVGIAGLLGSGRTELVRLLYGADRADSGYVEVAGTPARMTSPRHAIDRRIAFSSEDRREEGIVADLTVAENIVLGSRRAGGSGKPPGQAGFGSGRVHGGLDDATRRSGHGRRHLVGGQPAEGSHRPLARHDAGAPDPRRTDAGHRCRHEGRPSAKVASCRSKACPSSSSRRSSRRSCDRPADRRHERSQIHWRARLEGSTWMA